MPRQQTQRSTASRLISARQQEEERRLAAALHPQAAEDRPSDGGEEHDSEENDRPGEDQAESEEHEEECNEEEASAQIPNNAAGDRAAERDPVISAYRDCERARISSILRSPEAKANQRAALAFALDSAMPRDQAIAMLKAIGPDSSGRPGLNERMANIPRVGPGAPVKETTTADRQSTALAIVNAGRKVRGEAPLTQLPG